MAVSNFERGRLGPKKAVQAREKLVELTKAHVVNSADKMQELARRNNAALKALDPTWRLERAVLDMLSGLYGVC